MTEARRGRFSVMGLLMALVGPLAWQRIPHEARRAAYERAVSLAETDAPAEDWRALFEALGVPEPWVNGTAARNEMRRAA